MWQAFEREEKTKGILGAQARRLLSNLQIQPYLLAPRSSGPVENPYMRSEEWQLNLQAINCHQL